MSRPKQELWEGLQNDSERTKKCVESLPVGGLTVEKSARAGSFVFSFSLFLSSKLTAEYYDAEVISIPWTGRTEDINRPSSKSIGRMQRILTNFNRGTNITFITNLFIYLLFFVQLYSNTLTVKLHLRELRVLIHK